MESVDLAIKFFDGWNFDWVILGLLAFSGIALFYFHIKNMKNKDALVGVGEQ